MTANNNTIKPKFKKCKICKSEFQLFRTTQKVCSPNCAIALASADTRKKEKSKHTKAKKELKDNDRSFQIKKTQQIFNAYIRLRDMGLSCISCDRHHSGQYHAGHYRTVGANPELRFDERNCYKQCSACNNHLSGNLVNYRINLSGRVGMDTVNWLERNHPPKRYTIANLVTLQRWFNRKTKRLKKEMEL